MSYPKIEPIKIKTYTTKQSKYPQAAKLPIRSIVLGPSGSGKTILLQNFIIAIFDNCVDQNIRVQSKCPFGFNVASRQRLRKRQNGTRHR